MCKREASAMQLTNAFCFMRIHLTYSYVSAKMRKHKLQFKQIPLIACLHDQNQSGFFGGLAFIHPIRAILKVFKKLWLATKIVNRL